MAEQFEKGIKLISGLSEPQLMIVRGAIIDYLTKNNLNVDMGLLTIENIDHWIDENRDSVAPEKLSDFPALGEEIAQDFVPKQGIEADM
ncbi:MAG TPA: hypothetical protein PKZ16_02385 [bacterium]|nr:hypothetical protein [bacterium]HPL95829.1 hypothetical protein [bacterium]